MARNPKSVRFPVGIEESIKEWATKNEMTFNAAVVELITRTLEMETGWCSERARERYRERYTEPKDKT